MKKIKTIETKDGYYIHENEYLYFNGERPAKTFKYGWFFIPKNLPIRIEEKERDKEINHRFELRDKSLSNDKIPEMLSIKKDDDGNWVPIDESKNELVSLYKLKYDVSPPTFKPVEAEFDIILKTDIINTPETFDFRIAMSYGKIGTVSQNSFKNTTLDEIMFPEIVLHELPVTANSELVYAILRQYIRDNIDKNVACITSDYDFCFTVTKKIHLTKIEEFCRTFTKAGRKRKEIKEKSFADTRSIKVFEMTWAPKNYDNYTPIQPITGKNAKDLREKIIKLCKETIKLINQPFKDCPHCNGRGVVEAPDDTRE